MISTAQVMHFYPAEQLSDPFRSQVSAFSPPARPRQVGKAADLLPFPAVKSPNLAHRLDCEVDAALRGLAHDRTRSTLERHLRLQNALFMQSRHSPERSVQSA